MAKSKKVQAREEEESEESEGAAALLGIGIVGFGVWAWLRARRQPAGPAFAFEPSSQAKSQVVATSRPSEYVDFNKPRPQLGYADRARFGFAF